MKIREFVASQRELVIIGAIVAGLGVATKVRADAEGPRPVVRVDTLTVLTDNVRDLSRDVRRLQGDVSAMLRVACVTNPSKWEAFETAGIRCGDLIPSATQAGRTRR